jgi:15-cis-phytoene desaturase
MEATESREMAKKTVAVLGGGVGGLTAAQELAERGYQVDVYERNDLLGGKARSLPVPGSATGGRRPLPGEHGFRFFPGFYRHVPDTMARIPRGPGGGCVLDNLATVKLIQVARAGEGDLRFSAHLPRSSQDWPDFLRSFVAGLSLGVSPMEIAFFVSRLLVVLTACEERRTTEIERIPWWEFIDAERRSPAYRRHFATGLTRTLIAMRAEESSARTVSTILLQILFDLFLRRCVADRVLNGPTNDAWIDPWVSHLERLGVRLHRGVVVERLHVDGGRVRGVTAASGGEPLAIRADHYVAALPVEAMLRVAGDDVRRAAPSLAGLGHLRTAWMNGILFYLDRELPVPRAHTLFLDSPWALTSISQGPFWPGVDLSGLGDGRVRGILSVDISDWDTPGLLHGKPARRCSAREIRDEVWAQMKEHLNGRGAPVLEDARVVSWFLDPAIEFPEPARPHNREPLLINTAGSLVHRPAAATEIENLVLAADYVRTSTDLASMEGANEAARRAVNAILARDGARQPACGVWPLEEPGVFAPLRALDRERLSRGLPHVGLALPRSPGRQDERRGAELQGTLADLSMRGVG